MDRGYDVPTPTNSSGKKDKGGENEKKEGEGEKEGGGGGGGGEGGGADGDEGIRFLQRERFFGDFEREFAFPGPLQEFDITASLEDGILKVVAPKGEVSKGRFPRGGRLRFSDPIARL